MTVYIVTDGSYSDYRVCCICSTREKAEYAKKFYAADNDVETYTLDKLPDHPEGMLLYSVQMDRNGNCDEVETVTGAYVSDDQPYGDGKTVLFYAWATGSEHAVKIANERRVRLIESGKWTTDWNKWRNEQAKETP